MPGLAIVLSHIRTSLQWTWFAEELHVRGIEHFFVLTESEKPPLADDLERIGSQVYYLPRSATGHHLGNIIACWRLLRRHRPEVVHTSLPHGNLVGQLAGLLAGVRPRVTTCENASWAQDYGNWKQAAIDRLTYRLADKVIALTPVAARYLEETYGVPRGKLVAIPHALKPAAFEAMDGERIRRVGERLGIQEGEFTIGMVARMERWKGHRFAIEAMSQVITQRPNVRLVILGLGGEAEADVRAQITERRLERFVRLAGFVDDGLAAYRVFDVQLHVPISPLVETGGIAIIEGMLSGCAQVVTRSGFASGAARHLENCWVVDYQSSAGIAEALVRLHDEPALRKRLGAAARQDALRLFDFKQKFERHLEVYGVDAWRRASAAAVPVGRASA